MEDTISFSAKGPSDRPFTIVIKHDGHFHVTVHSDKNGKNVCFIAHRIGLDDMFFYGYVTFKRGKGLKKKIFKISIDDLRRLEEWLPPRSCIQEYGA